MSDWREAQATALEALTAELERSLEALEWAEAILEVRNVEFAVLAELRGVEALLRVEVSAMRGEARELRLPAVDHAPQLTAAITRPIRRIDR